METFDLRDFVKLIKNLARDEQMERASAETIRVSALTIRDPSSKFRQQVYLKRLDRLSRFLRDEDVPPGLTPSEADAFAILRVTLPQFSAPSATAPARKIVSPPSPPAATASQTDSSSAAATLALPAQKGTSAAAATITPAEPLRPATPPVAPAQCEPQATLPAAPPEPEPQAAPVPPAAAAPSKPAAAKTGAERRGSVRIHMKTRVRVLRESGEVMEIVQPLNISRGGIGFESKTQYELNECLIVNMHYQPGEPESELLAQRARVVRCVPLSVGKGFSYGLKFESQPPPAPPSTRDAPPSKQPSGSGPQASDK